MSTPNKIRAYRPRRSQAQRRYPLRDLQPIPLRPWRIDWPRDIANLIGAVVLMIATVYLWRVLPW